MGRLLICAAVFLTAAEARADVITFAINANGFKEVNAAGVPGQGDPDGFAIGTITLNNGTGSGNTGSAIINLRIGNLDPNLSGHHIHQAPANTTGPIVLDFGDPDNILTGTPASGVLSGTFTGLSSATINSIIANPTGFYYNMHNTPNFPGGAVRDQLGQLVPVPEPATFVLFGVGAAVALRLRRRS